MPASASRVLGALALVASTLALLLVVTAGPGTRFGLWDFRSGLGLLRFATFAAIAGLVIGLFQVFVVGARTTAAVALVMAVLALVVPLLFLLRAKSVPPIHDITTDTDDPPAFAALLAARAGGNPSEYGGPEIAAQQRAAYPDLTGAVLPEPPARAFERARQAAEALGWEIRSGDLAEGRLEATDTTFWFGFKDDVVVRVRPEAGGSRIDVRSVSRVGVSDIGTNARRIRAFLKQLQG
jgi:hypothetical protein